MNKCKHLGFSLLEVLISLTIFSVGLLGYSGLQHRAQIQQIDISQRFIANSWLNRRANEISSYGPGQSISDSKVEGLLHGQGCVEWEGGSNSYMVTLVWQGLSDIKGQGTEHHSCGKASSGNSRQRSIDGSIYVAPEGA